MKRTALLFIVLVAFLGSNGGGAYAQIDSIAFADPTFEALWNRSDAAVAAQRTTASWLWGPGPLTGGLREPYAESAGGTRLVQYFDKARMEITDPDADRGNPWFVTNGLLPIELITGQLQVGAAQFASRQPATLAAIGDADNTFPTYADLASVFTRQGAGDTVGNPVTGFLNPDGSINGYDAYRTDPATQIALVENQHGIPAGFMNYMTERSGALGRLFVFGHPVSGAYWVTVKVGRVVQPVMFQVFERRILTYTPNNPPAFRVESGNVGLHYLQWRYPAPRLTVTPPQGPAGTTFTIQVSGLPAGERATLIVNPPPLEPARSLTVVGTGGDRPVAIDIPTTRDQYGTWFVTIARSAIAPVISSSVQFTVTEP